MDETRVHEELEVAPGTAGQEKYRRSRAAALEEKEMPSAKSIGPTLELCRAIARDPPARLATVGCSKMARSGRSHMSSSRMRATMRVASNEWPPRSKKLSSVESRSTLRTSRQMA